MKNLLKQYEFIICLVPLFIPFLIGFNLVSLSFAINGILISSLLVFLLFISDSEHISLSIFAIFLAMFFILAPIIQLQNSELIAVNRAQLSSKNIIYSNLIIFLFIGSSLLTYFTFSRKVSFKESGLIFWQLERNATLLKLLILISAVLAIYAVYVNYQTALINFGGAKSNNENSIFHLIQSKVLFLIPFLTFSIFFFGNKVHFKKPVLILSFLVIAILLVKNPILDRRNALGPVYLAIFFLFMIKKNFYFKGFFFHTSLFSLALIFPLSSLLTHMNLYSGKNFSISTILSNHFAGLHYDAWSSIVASIEYVSINGFHWGNQLLGSIFFYIPRSLWSEKPNSSAVEVGNYLIESSSLWFNNISVSLPAEGFIDFGLFGVVFFGSIFALLMIWIDELYYQEDSISKVSAIFFALSIFFIMRGSLLPAFSYTLGAFIALRIFPVILFKLLIFLDIINTKK